MRCQVVFVESKPGGVLIDVVAAATTLSLEADLPFSAWGLAAALALGRWAAEGAEVGLQFYDARGSRRVRISDGERLVVLDLRRILAGRPATATLLSHAGGNR